jgi:hypothetical protein
VASFDRAIPPGGEGRITLKVNTRGYDGRIHKSARVSTNEPGLKAVNVAVKAFIKPSIFLSRPYVNLSGPEGQSVTKSVEIKAGLEEPLRLEPAGFNLEGKVSYSIEEIEKGRRFKVRFSNTSDRTGSYTGFLKLKTNYFEKPEIFIRIRG